MLGRTEEEAGKVFGLKGQSSVETINEKLQTQISVIQNSYYKDKKSIEQIKGFNHLDEITAGQLFSKKKMI